MHADIVKLLDLQTRDDAVAELDRQLEALAAEEAALDAGLRGVRDAAAAARREAEDAARRRDELEAKIEGYRVLQERRRQRLEFVRNAKEAATLMAELDLARSVLAREEGEWVRSADAVMQAEARTREREREVAGLEEAQAPERAALGQRRAAIEAQRAAAVAAREASAALLDKPLRIRYDRLRRARPAAVVPLVGDACGACHTAVPLNRRTRIRAGAVVDGCESCGAILYPAEHA
jgi:predicted  nucleic acid-binding Zn-ribbon protein